MENLKNIEKNSIDTQVIAFDQIKYKSTHTQLKSNVLELLNAKIEHILSCYLTLGNEDEIASRSIKLNFYEDKDSKIEELENLKETLDTEFQNINASYQSDKNFKQLLKSDEEISNIYLKYTETYNEFSVALRKTIKRTIEKSFSPYFYEDSKILYSVNSHIYPIKLIQYDIEKSQQMKIDINLPKPLTNDDVSVVQLPNNELFCFGKSNRDSCNAWIIDLNSYEIKRTLPSIRYPNRSGIIYCQQSVYVISGLLSIIFPIRSSSNPLPLELKEDRTNKRFDLISNKWVSLPKLPRRITSCSAVPYKHKILFTGVECENFIYSYDINLESFHKIDLHQNPTEKLLIAGNSRLYLLEAWGSLWESEYDNEYIWNRVSKFEKRLFTAQSYRVVTSTKVYIGVFEIYHTTSKYLYYEFNLKEKELKEIKSFKGPSVGSHFEYEYD